MKKTFSINIAGFPFTIDEDAYTLLNDYLKTIEHAFASVEDSSELVNDIESRIAELLLISSDNGTRILTLADIDSVIARIGKPEEMIEADESINIDANGDEEVVINEETRTTPPPYIPPLPPQQKKLYRDPSNALLGGVCSGIAWYLGWDVTWVRLLVVALAFVSWGTVAVIYIILWIVVPEAVTPLQRMQMMGEQPTMQNIGRTVSDTFREDQGEKVNQQPSSAPQAAGTLATIFSILAKACIIFGLIIAIPILCALVLGLIGSVFFFLMWGTTLLFGTGLPFDSPEFDDPYVTRLVFWGVMCGIGWILTLAIPLYLLVRKGLNRKSTFTPSTKKGLWIVWIAGFILAACSTGMVINSAFQQEVNAHRQWVNHHIESNAAIDEIMTEQTVDSLTVQDSTIVTDTVVTTAASEATTTVGTAI